MAIKIGIGGEEGVKVDYVGQCIPLGGDITRRLARNERISENIQIQNGIR